MLPFLTVNRNIYNFITENFDNFKFIYILIFGPEKWQTTGGSGRLLGEVADYWEKWQTTGRSGRLLGVVADYWEKWQTTRRSDRLQPCFNCSGEDFNFEICSKIHRMQYFVKITALKRRETNVKCLNVLYGMNFTQKSSGTVSLSLKNFPNIRSSCRQRHSWLNFLCLYVHARNRRH